MNIRPLHDRVIVVGLEKVQKVLFGKYAGTEIQIEGKAHLIMREDDIIGIIEK